MTSTKYRTLSTNEIMYVLNHASYCLLGVVDIIDIKDLDDTKPYIVPMDYIYPQPNLFILKSYNNSGKKMKILDDNDNVCLEFNYRHKDTIMSVIVFGTAEVKQVYPEDVSPLYEIKVTATNMTGRKYYINHHH